MLRYTDAMLEIEKQSHLYPSRRAVDQQLAKSVPDQSVRNFLLTNLVEESPNLFKFQCRLDLIKSSFDQLMDFPDHLKVRKNVIDTCVIYGGDSGYVTQESSSSLSSSPFSKIFGHPLEKFTWKCIAGAGHWVHAEKPNQFLSCFEEHIHHINKL